VGEKIIKACADLKNIKLSSFVWIFYRGGGGGGGGGGGTGVYHGYMREVYKFMWFGDVFISCLVTSGTGRTAQIMLGEKLSRIIPLRRGFAQGNSSISTKI
jgi:hypothetical protein